MNIQKFCFFVFLFFAPYLLLAQNLLGIPLLYTYSKTVFQGGSRTWDIKQDRRGIMYFANNEGMITFNGKQWKRYVLPNHTIARSLFIDVKDRIYIGGQGEFGYFEAGTEGDLSYTSLKNKVPQVYQGFSDVWNTVELGSSIFFRTSHVIFEWSDGKIKVHRALQEWDFMGTAAGRLFAQDKKQGLLEYKEGRWVSIATSSLFSGVKIAAIFEVKDGELRMVTQNNKSYRLQGSQLERLAESSYRDYYTPSAQKINDAEYVVATASKGYVVYRMNGELQQEIGAAEGLPNRNVSSIFVDQQKNIWLAVDNAISVISYGSAIRYFRPNLSNDVTGYSTLVFNNQLYMSSSNGVYRAPLSSTAKDHSFSAGRFTLIPESDRGEAWRLEVSNKELFLGHNRGLYKFEREQLRPLSSGVGVWRVLPLSATYPVAHSLVGTYFGIDLLSYTDNQFTHRSLKGHFDSYRFLAQDELGNVWSSHPYRGIYRLKVDVAKGAYKAQLFTDKEGLPSAFQNYVFKLKNKVIFTTAEGIYTFDNQTQRFVPAPIYAAFKGMAVTFMQEDAEGNLWFTSGKKVGVARYMPQDGRYKITFFPEIEGLHTSGFENINPYDWNNIYIGAEKGVIHINDEQYRKEAHKPEVLIASVRNIGLSDTTLFNGYFLYQENAKQEQGKAQIPHLASSFDSYRFEYAAPSYGVHAYLTYSYMLEGYDKKWSNWSKQTEKDYTNLSSGTYTFKVKAKNNLDEESVVASYTFVISPPWYKTIWAYFIYLLLASCLFYFIRQAQQRAAAMQQRKFDARVAELHYIHQLEKDKNEKEIVKLKNEHLEHEIQSKTKELASTSMQLMENSGALTRLRMELTKLDKGMETDDLKRITSLLKDVESNTSNWDQFATHFDELNDGFLHRLKQKHSALSRNDLKVCAYLRLHFTSKQIAQLQNISVRGVEIHRYRLRKKLGIETEQSLNDYLSNI